MSIKIDQIYEMKDILEVTFLMKRIWNLSDKEVVSSMEMRSVARFGILLGAYNSENSLIGFIYAFPMNNSKHYSHMMGVDPDYQGKGIGFELKLKHRIIALKMGISTIEWTVDPLLPNNSRLNFNKLGCICNTYYPNYYGLTNDTVGIYAGLPTDRFLVEWNLNDEKVIKRLSNKTINSFSSKNSLNLKYPILNITPLNNNDEKKIFNSLSGYKISFQVPADFQKIKKENIELALKWRLLFRKISKVLFSNGFAIVDYIVINKNRKDQENYYLFEKNQYSTL